MKHSSILKIINNHTGGNVYVVGGAVRDRLMGIETFDIDFATPRNPEKLARMFAKKINASVVRLDEVNKIYRVVKKSGGRIYHYDFTKFRGKNIEDDVRNRDLTINSIAVKLSDFIKYADKSKTALKSVLIDPAGGQDDIKNKTIRIISEKSILDDPLRMMRIFRFAAVLKFGIEPATLKLAKKHSGLITRSSAERIRDEFLKILSAENSSGYVIKLDKAGLLEKIFPEVTTLKQSAKKFYYHPHGLWHHLTETLAALEEIIFNINKNFPENNLELSDYLSENISSSTRLALLKYVTLLHDIGKPLSIKRIKNRVRFFGHEVIGTKLFEKISKKIKLSNDEINFGKSLIKNHMRILQLVGTKSTTERATYRLLRDAGENLPALALLSIADAKSYVNLPEFKKNNLKEIMRYARQLVKLYFAKQKEKPRKKIIDGHILMKKLKLKPGPIIGELLTLIDEEYNLKKISTTDEAISLAKKHLISKYR